MALKGYSIRPWRLWGESRKEHHREVNTKRTQAEQRQRNDNEDGDTLSTDFTSARLLRVDASCRQGGRLSQLDVSYVQGYTVLPFSVCWIGLLLERNSYRERWRVQRHISTT